MEFNAKFFLTALILTTIAGIPSHLTIWLELYRLKIELYTWISVFLTPIQFTLSIILPFALMYTLATNLNPEQPLKPIITSTFLGCWIGAEAILATDILIRHLRGTLYGIYIPQTIFYITWQIFTAALSPILFVSLTAILLTHYKKQKQQTKPPQPP